jgi:hypothetical protein
MSGFNLVKIIDPQVIVTGGLVPKGAYNGATSYNIGDSVSYNNASYVALAAGTGNLPTDTTHWQLLSAQGATGTGTPGATGQGVPVGGTTGQILAKTSNTDYATAWQTVSAGGVTSVAGRTGIVVLAEADITNLTTDLAATEKTANKNAVNGYAGLDGGGKVAIAQLPSSVLGALEYQGTYDASSGVYPASPSKGYYYVVSVAGTISTIPYKVNDWMTYDGTGWDKIDNGQTVSSVAGRTGAIVLAESDITNLTTDLSTINTNISTNTTAIGTKAPLASPTFTGVPVAPTATALTSNTQIATTAYADASSSAAVTADTIHLLKAGDTMTGALTIQPTIASSAPIMYVNAFTGSSNNVAQIALNGANLFSISSGGTVGARNIQPNSTLAYSLGSTGLYYQHVYSSRFDLNSTAYLDGGTTGRITSNADLFFSNGTRDTPGFYFQSSTDRWPALDSVNGLFRFFSEVNGGGGGIVQAAIDTSGTSANNKAMFGPWNSGSALNIGLGWTGGTITDSMLFFTGGSTTESMRLTSNNLLGIGTNAPTHTLTLPSTATGIALYNTVDQTTNYERVLMSWVSNVFTIQNNNGGTGSQRNIAITSQGGTLAIGSTSSYTRTTAGAIAAFTYTGTESQASAAFTGLSVSYTYNQTGSSSATDLLINRTETLVGSGIQRLADFQVGSVSKASIDNGGLLRVASFINQGSTQLLGSLTLNPGARTAAISLTNTNAYLNPCDATTAAFTVTLPNAVSFSGLSFWIGKIDSSVNAVTVATAGGQVNYATTWTLATQGKYIEVFSNGTNWIAKNVN